MKIVVIGGGTGSTVVLEGLKKYKELNLSVIVGMMDDGGSNAVVRDEFGLLPLSDVRKSILALSESSNNDILRELFMYRFSSGDGIKGHTLGNLLMIAMTEIVGSEVEAIAMFKNLFGVRGEVIPVTLDKVRLVAEYDDGSKVVGEHYIDEPEKHKDIVSFYLDSEAIASEDALHAIQKADFVVLGPGDLYTTILPNILVSGISDALKKSKAKIVYVTNLMSKIGQTRNKTQKDIVEVLEKYMGRKVDYLLINNGKIPEKAYERYRKDGEDLLPDNLHDGDGRTVLRKDLVATGTIRREKGDSLSRSFVRHDSEKLARELYRAFTREENNLKRLILSLLAHYKD